MKDNKSISKHAKAQFSSAKGGGMKKKGKKGKKKYSKSMKA